MRRRPIGRGEAARGGESSPDGPVAAPVIRSNPRRRRSAQRAAWRAASTAAWTTALLGLAVGIAPPVRAADDVEVDDANVEAPVSPASDPDASGESAATAPETTTASETAADAEAKARRAHPIPPPPLGTRFAEPLADEQVRIRYQWRRVKSQGLMIGDRDARPGYVRTHQAPFRTYAETPRALDVTTHLVEVAYAPHPRTTLAVQIPFIQKDLETLEADGDRRRDATQGVGDIAFALIVPFIQKGRESSHVHIALDVPSGSLRKRDADGRRLPYDSQLGNGTVDFEWGWTYRGEYDWISWGGQALGHHPLGKNGLDYREGSRFEASLWSAARLVGGLSASLRVQWQKQNNLSGRDRDFDPIVDPSENDKARGGTRFLIGPGLAYDLPARFGGQRLSLELAVPVHQDLDGPQLEQDWNLTTGWQWAF